MEVYQTRRTGATALLTWCGKFRIISETIFAIPPGTGRVHVSAKPKPGQKGIQFQFGLVFYDPSGRAMSDGKQVYESSTGRTDREFDVPHGAARAVFSARSVSGGKKAAFSRFEIKPDK